MTVLELQIPNLHMVTLAPMLIVVAGACLGVLVEAFLPRPLRHAAQASLGIASLVAAAVLATINWGQGRTKIAGVQAVAVDGPTYLLWLMLLVFGALALFMFAERGLYDGNSVFTPAAWSVPGSEQERGASLAHFEHTEVYPIALLSISGMMLFCAANDLLTMFVGLEIFSLPLYILCGLARRRRLLSQEAAMKYFLLGSMSSAVFLFGIALIYGYAGSFRLDPIAETLGKPSTQGYALLLTGMALASVGLLFKIGAVPFHSWTPDVYQGAPTPVTAFMAACTKIAAVGAMLRFFYVALGGAKWEWAPLLSVIALLTMLVGSVLAITQTDIKRMLAYSSIAHAGFILTGALGANSFGSGLRVGQLPSVSAILFYLAAYGFATMGAFAIVTMIRREGAEASTIASWAGMGRRRPFLGLTFALFLLSFAGIPLTAGFMGKWAVFVSAWQGGYPWLVVVAVLMSLVAAFFYVRVILIIFFGHGEDADAAGVELGLVGRASWLTWVPVVVGLCATLAMGIYPQPVLDLVERAGIFLR